MAQLAIKGHATRGKEVIQLLEMFGGKNIHRLDAIRDCYVYFVMCDKNKTISSLKLSQVRPEQFIIYSLEEFFEKFPFKDGDILTYTGNYTTIFIYRIKENEPNFSTSFYVGCNDAPTHNFFIYNKYTLIALNENCDVRLATPKEKQQLFDAIKEHGYKWNSETKTLEKLVEPKFKVGDRIIKRDSIVNSWIVSSVSSEYYGLQLPSSDGIGVLPIVEQDDYELVSDIEPKFKKGDKIKHKVNTEWVCTIRRVEDRYYVDGHPTCFIIPFDKQYEYELVSNKFDITTLKPFDKVLVRLTKDGVWNATFFSHYDKEVKWGCYPFITTGSKSYPMCIPYNEDTKYLLGTTNDCDEFYKTR